MSHPIMDRVLKALKNRKKKKLALNRNKLGNYNNPLNRPIVHSNSSILSYIKQIPEWASKFNKPEDKE